MNPGTSTGPHMEITHLATAPVDSSHSGISFDYAGNPFDHSSIPAVPITTPIADLDREIDASFVTNYTTRYINNNNNNNNTNVIIYSALLW